MINFDINNLPQALRVFLCKPDNSVICELNGIEPSGASLKINLNNQDELEFDYYRYIDDKGTLIESNGYDSLTIGMRLFVENYGYFKMKYPPYSYDGEKETKHITAYSIEHELEDRDLVNFKINTGEETSYEYLVEYETKTTSYSPNGTDHFYITDPITHGLTWVKRDGVNQVEGVDYTLLFGDDLPNGVYAVITFNETLYRPTKVDVNYVVESEDLLNPYTGVPYDYIVFYNTFPEQLAVLNEKYSDGTITDEDDVKEIVSYCKLIPRLVSKAIRNPSGEITSVAEYVKYTYNAAGTEVVSVELSGFNTRVSQLIAFYTKYRKQLSLIDLAIENSNTLWAIGDIDDSLVNKRCQFDIDGQNIYSFLTQDIATQSKCLAQFDYVNYKINYVSLATLGIDSGVILDKQNLINNINISTVEDNIVTRYNVSGGNDLNIMDVNFGSNRLVNIDYYLNAKDSSGHRIYLSDSLADKYESYKSDIELARKTYIDTVRTLRQLQKDIDEITYRVPNDEVKNDWGTFTLAELEAANTHYNNLLATLKSLYREDYPNGVDANDEIIDSVTPPAGKVSIRYTMYWHDYFAYNEAIEQIGAAILAIQNNITYKEISPDDTLIDGNGNAVNVAELIAAINAWETEWSLYGINELQAKINVYNDNLNTLIDSKSVLINSNGTSREWGNLTTLEKAEYADESYYNIAKAEYDKNKTERDSCQTYLNTLKAEVAAKQTAYNDASEILKQIRILVALDTYQRRDLHKYVSAVPNTYLSFNATEKKIITNFYVDHNYSNDNILITSIDDVVSVIDIEEELLADAKEQLSIESQPQFSFTTDIDNLMAVTEFKDYKFNVGNYAIVQYYDDYYVKLRLDTLRFNPFAPEESLDVTFTNYTKSNAERSDVSYILGQASGSSGSSGSGGSGGSNEFGTSDKIDITISNTMLAKLLNTEMFASRVSDVALDTMRLNRLNVKYATFGGLKGGVTVIDGSCIRTGSVRSNNYNGTVTDITSGGEVIGHTYGIDNTAGSVLNLSDGSFNFGGGKLVFDATQSSPTLTVKGHIIAENLSTGNKTSSTSDSSGNSNGLFIDSLGNLYAGSTNQTQINADGSFNFGSGNLTYDSTNGLSITGSITATTGTIGNWTISDGDLIGERIIRPVPSFLIKYKTYIKPAVPNASQIFEQPFIYTTRQSKQGDNDWSTDSGGVIEIYPSGRILCTEINCDNIYTFNGINVQDGNDGYVEAAHINANVTANFVETDFGSDSYFMKAFRESTEVVSGAGRRAILRANTNNGAYLGSSAYRWHSVYCGDGAFNGSDKKIKNHIKYLSDEEKIEDFILSLKPVMYTLKSGESHRHHLGFYAQDVSKTANETIGDVAIYQASVLTKDENGEIVEGYYDPNVNDDNLSWVMNYSELLAPTISVLQRAIHKISLLEAEIQELKGE